MDDLIAFYRARLDEDEQVALAAIRKHEAAVAAVAPLDSPAEWSSGSDESGTGDYRQAVWAGEGSVTVCEMFDEYDEVTAAHIARHDPARVLADVDAKRRILYEHRQAMPGWCETCDIPGDYKGRPEGCTTVRLLALPYADHHDYREEWKP